MPGKPKPGKGSKKRPASGGPSRNADRKKDETRAKRKRPVRPLTSTDAGASTADLPSHFSGGPEPEPVPSSDESDIEVKVNPNVIVENVQPEEDVVPFVPSVDELEELFESENVVELQVIASNSSRSTTSRVFFEGHDGGGLLLPTPNELDHILDSDGTNNLELEVIKTYEGSDDVLEFD